MKKVLSVLLIVLVLFASACGKQTDAQPTSSVIDIPVTESPGENGEDTTPAPTQNPQQQESYYTSEEYGKNLGFFTLSYDVDKDGENDLICVSYQEGTAGDKAGQKRKIVAIEYGGAGSKPDSVLIQDDEELFKVSDSSQLTCVALDDGYLILEDTNDIGGSRIFETAYPYYFNGEEITALPPLDDLVKDSVSIKFKSDKQYELTFKPTGEKFTGVVPDAHLQSEQGFDKEYCKVGECVVVFVNALTGEVAMRFAIDIGGYKFFKSARLDIAFEFDILQHTYKIKSVDFAYDDGTNSMDFDLDSYYENQGTVYITPPPTP